MKKVLTAEVLIGMLLGVVVLGGLGHLAVKVNDHAERLSALETQRRANLEDRVAANETDIAVIKALSTRVDALSARVAELSTATGQIVTPKEGDVVSSVFSYDIQLDKPAETKYYYLVNRIGGLCWPKVRINPRSGQTRYTGNSDEGGSPAGGRFSVVLFEVDRDEHEAIMKWLNGTDFPGVQVDGRELGSVDIVLRR